MNIIFRAIYRGEDIKDHTRVPVVNGTVYEVHLVRIPFRNGNGEISSKTSARIFDTTSQNMLAVKDYHQDDWHII